MPMRRTPGGHRCDSFLAGSARSRTRVFSDIGKVLSWCTSRRVALQEGDAGKRAVGELSTASESSVLIIFSVKPPESGGEINRYARTGTLVPILARPVFGAGLGNAMRQRLPCGARMGIRQASNSPERLSVVKYSFSRRIPQARAREAAAPCGHAICVNQNRNARPFL